MDDQKIHNPLNLVNSSTFGLQTKPTILDPGDKTEIRIKKLYADIASVTDLQPQIAAQN